MKQGNPNKSSVVPFWRSVDIRVMVITILLLAIVIPIALKYLIGFLFDISLNWLAPTLMATIGGFGGLIQVIRKESMGPFGNKIYGKTAIFQGIMLAVVFWGLGLVDLAMKIINLINQR